MRFLGLLVLTLGLTLSSCVKNGKGEMITQKFDVGTFDEIDFDGIGKVEVIPSTSFYVDVEAQENIMKIIEVKKKGSVLKVGLKPGYQVSGKTKIRYTIYANSIVGLTNTGSGSLEAKDGSLGENLNVKNTGSGNVEFVSSANIKNLDIAGTGSGNINAEFIGENISIKNTGSGNFELDFVAQNIDLKNTGSGDIKIKGGGITFEPTLTGSGDLDAYDFYCSKVNVKTSGSGNATVYVQNSLFVTITGSGDVFYKGNPSELNTDISGSGNLVKIN